MGYSKSSSKREVHSNKCLPEMPIPPPPHFHCLICTPLIPFLISAPAVKSGPGITFFKWSLHRLKSPSVTACATMHVIICCFLVFLMTMGSLRVGALSLCPKHRAWNIKSLLNESTLIINVCLLQKPSFSIQLFQLIVFILLQKNSSIVLEDWGPFESYFCMMYLNSQF